MTDTQRRAAAKQFAADWAGKGYEKGHSQVFWLSLLQKVYGVTEPDKFIIFEDQVMLDHTSFIDGFIPSTHVLIEQKSLGKELNKPIKQSDGSLLSPFQQAKRYAASCPIPSAPAGSLPATLPSFMFTTWNALPESRRLSVFVIWKKNTIVCNFWWILGTPALKKRWRSLYRQEKL